MSNDAFIQASKGKLRFTTSRGQITVEDLWSLSLRDLDTLGQKVIAESGPTVSSLLTNPDPKVNTAKKENDLRLEIIKTIIGIKEAENSAALAAAGNRRRKEMLQEILESKKIESLGGKSIAELEAEIASLG
jgi:hypothetical protein